MKYLKTKARKGTNSQSKSSSAIPTNKKLGMKQELRSTRDTRMKATNKTTASEILKECPALRKKEMVKFHINF